MDYSQTLSEANKEARATGKRLHGLKLRGDIQARIALSCFAVAQQHHSAILVLLSHFNPMPSSALALLRPLLEATLRGFWVIKCASDTQGENLVSGVQKQVDMAGVINALKDKAGIGDKYSSFYREVWPALSAYLHTYETQLQPWLAGQNVESNYTEVQLSKLVCLASKTMALAELGVVSLGVTENMAEPTG